MADSAPESIAELPRGDAGAATSGPAVTTRLFPALPLALAALLAGFTLFPPVSSNPRLAASFLGVAALIAGWSAWLAWRARRSGRSLAVELAPPAKAHYVQTCVQITIYTYWAAYWPQVISAIPLILGQMAFLYALDGLLALSRGRRWRLGMGPVPVIFSTNLFLWFKDDWFAFQFAMIAICALAKEFLRWNRDGRSTHVFNPSAFGLAVVSLVLIGTGTTRLTWGIEVATTLGWPPHMYLVIFGLGLVVQYLFSVTLMTFAAVAVLYGANLVYTQVTGVYHFVDTNIPVAIFLGLHLLVTDPATSPKTSVGRLIFGGLYGAANFVLFSALGAFDVPDFYDKLLPVPLLNLGVKAFDAVARWPLLEFFTRWEAKFRPRRVNLAHMGGWGALFATMFATGFVEAPHPGASIAFWRQAFEDGKPAAGRNWMKMVGSRAEAGDARACNQLGRIYLDGEVVAQDRIAAAAWFARSCELGHPRGCESVARHFLRFGEAASAAIVERAFDALERDPRYVPDGIAEELVGEAYERGLGRPLDRERAIASYGAGAQRGNLAAAKGVARLWLAGAGGGDALVHAAPRLERASAAGDAEGAYFLAHLLHAGAGVSRDAERAERLLERSCELGLRDGCEALASPERWLGPARLASR